jgi:hypothetical protein
MQARVVRPLRGAHWLASGWRLFAAAPLGWLAVVFVYWLAMMLISLLPLGGAVAPVLVPGFSVGFMAAGRAAARGAPVELAHLFEPFRHAPRPQLALGVLYLASLAALLGVSWLLDDGLLAQVMLSSGGELQAEMRGTLTVVMLLYIPVMMLFWFAPTLAAWHATGVGKSLFFSFVACLVNWRAFLVYGALTVLAPALVLLGLAQALGAAALRTIALPLAILVLPTLLASFYASYRDVFGGEAAE